MNVFGRVYICMEGYGCVRKGMDVYGRGWMCMEEYGGGHEGQVWKEKGTIG